MRSVVIYAALLAGSLGWAYQTWTHQDELALADKVVIMPGKPEQLASVAYRSESLELTVEFREDDQGRYAWGRTVPLGDPPPAPPAPEGGEPPPAPPAPEPEEFKVGKSGTPVFEALAPFVAKRKLEGVGEEDLEALGLAEPEATLEIAREGKEPRVFELGGNVFGGANVYVRDPSDGVIYLVEARTIRPLRSGSRTLPDRDLSGIAERKAERLTLRVGDRQATFEQHNPDDPEAKYWSVAGEDESNPDITAWVGKALRLRSTRYVQSDESPVDLAPAFAFVIRSEGGETVEVEVLRNFDDEGQEQFFARSQHTRGLVRLPRATAAEASTDLESALQAGGA